MDRILETLCWTVTLKALEDLNQVKSMDQKCYISCPSYKNHIIIFISFSFKVNIYKFILYTMNKILIDNINFYFYLYCYMSKKLECQKKKMLK